MSAPLRVSVVSSAYNAAPHLRESIRSVLDQEGVDLEMIVIDDGSTDETPAILGELAREDRRLRVVSQGNRGLTQALIAGCALARGELIARHDPDDLSLPGRLARQAVALERDPSLVFVSCWTRAVGPKGETLFETRGSASPDVATRRLLVEHRGPAGHGSFMFRRSAYERVGGYRPEFYFAQDSDLWLRLGEVGRLAIVPELLYAYRVAERGVSASYRKTQTRIGRLGHRCQAARAAGLPEEEILREAARLRPPFRGRARDGSYFIASCLLARRDPRALGYFRRAVARRPADVRAWLGIVRSLLPRVGATLRDGEVS